jgi:hypothetical protein
MEILLDRQHAAIKELAQQMLADAKNMYVDAEAHANATTKHEEDLNTRSLTVSKLERAMVERDSTSRPTGRWSTPGWNAS